MHLWDCITPPQLIHDVTTIFDFSLLLSNHKISQWLGLEGTILFQLPARNCQGSELFLSGCEESGSPNSSLNISHQKKTVGACSLLL